MRVQDRLLRLVKSGVSAVNAWLDALVDRHTAAFSTSEFLKAVRALSARYVESRHSLPNRSPLDTAGKRAAFAAFYAPLHFFTAREVVAATGANGASLESIVDLGCGTGVVSAAWALGGPRPASVVGIDRNGWALGEANWNWATLGIRGRTIRADLGAPLRSLLPERLRSSPRQIGLALGWTVNELPESRREALLDEVLETARAGASVLVIEPIARAMTPWWKGWAERVTSAGGRADEWKFDVELPPRLAALDEAAGFRREGLGAKSLWLPGTR